MKPIRVLIIDDSLTMRKLIAASLRRDPAIEVVGEAADPIEGRQAIKALNPDVITLDIEMPKMNGLDFLEKIMRLRPMPVIMLSNMTTQGASASIEALAQGAFDCIAKPQTADDRTFEALIESVKSAAGARVQSGCQFSSGPGCRSCAGVGGTELSFGWTDRGHWRLDRRRRSADHDSFNLSGRLSADGRNPAHASRFHLEFCQAPRPALCAAGQRGYR